MQGADFEAICEREQLQAVLAYVGSKQHLYTCGVNKAFRAHYHKKPTTDDAGKLNELPKCCVGTGLRAVFASPPCLRLAVECGLNIGLRCFQFDAGRHASIETLEAAKQLGLQLDMYVCQGAARSGFVPKRRWLVEDQHTTLPDDVARHAARSGSVGMMQWLHQKGCLLMSTLCQMQQAPILTRH